jgi:hypothetical protein
MTKSKNNKQKRTSKPSKPSKYSEYLTYSPIILSKDYLTRAQCKLNHSNRFNVSKSILFKLDDTIEPNFYSISKNRTRKSRSKRRSQSSRTSRTSKKSSKSRSSSRKSQT